MMSFEEALKIAADRPKTHLLLGNEFSRALRNDVFNYGALFDRADFSALSANVKQAFDILDTRDFEIVMQALRGTVSLLRIYDPTNPIIAQLQLDEAGLREVLAKAIADSHPERPASIDEDAFRTAENFYHTLRLSVP